jgi:hypothetical protein
MTADYGDIEAPPAPGLQVLYSARKHFALENGLTTTVFRAKITRSACIEDSISMIPILAGGCLWLLVILLAVAGVELGSAAISMLLALGAILVASSIVDTVKVSASGFEFKTKQPDKIEFSLPKIDYFNTICWIFIVGTILSPFFAREQDGPKLGFAAVLSFILFAIMCIRSGLKRRMRDPNSAE